MKTECKAFKFVQDSLFCSFILKAINRNTAHSISNFTVLVWTYMHGISGLRNLFWVSILYKNSPGYYFDNIFIYMMVSDNNLRHTRCGIWPKLIFRRYRSQRLRLRFSEECMEFAWIQRLSLIPREWFRYVYLICRNVDLENIDDV